MKFKERLWQLFLMIVLGVTLSVCDAGDSDENFDENLLTAGTAIASGSSSTSVTSGDGYVKIGDLIINYGSFNNSNDLKTINFTQVFSSTPFLQIQCIQNAGNGQDTFASTVTSTLFKHQSQAGCGNSDYPIVKWLAIGT